MKKFLILFMGLLVLLSCAKKNDEVIEEYYKTDTIQLEEPANFLLGFKKISIGFVGYDLDAKALKLYSNDGKFLDKYDKRGKAPGEIAGFFAISSLDGDTLFGIDHMTERVMVFDVSKGKIKYLYEFRSDMTAGRILSIGVYGENLICRNLSAKYRSSIYSKEGRLLKQVIPVEMKKETFLESVGEQGILDKTYLLTKGKNNIHFYKIDDNENLTLLKESHTKFTPGNGKNEFPSAPMIIENTFLLGFKKESYLCENFFEIYDTNGDYIGKKVLPELTKEEGLLSGTFSDDGDTFWYQVSNFVKSKKETKKDEDTRKININEIFVAQKK